MNKNEEMWLICSKQQLSHAQSFEFSVPIDKLPSFMSIADGFVLNWQGDFFAYLNSCPHTGVNLNWLPNQFFGSESRFLQCSLHGAMFEPASGLCIRGPCAGQSLPRLPLLEHDNNLYLDLVKLSIN